MNTDATIDDIPLLAGEGEIKVVIKKRVRRYCDNCGEVATKRVGFCYINGRRNPASSMYGRDDCSYCVDSDAFSCNECVRSVERNYCPDGMNWAVTFSQGGRCDHMFLKWSERPATEAELAAMGELV